MHRLLFSFVFVLGLTGETVAIQNARVIDGTGAPAAVRTVLIRDGRIAAVGTEVAVPAEARVIDASGQTLLPGLFDLHTHLAAAGVSGVSGDWGKNLKAYLACGVTSVNDYSAYGEMFAPMRHLMDGILPSPRVNLAARISTTGGHGTESGWGDFFTLVANTPEQARAAVRRALRDKPDILKIFTDGWRYGSAPDLTSMNLETLTAAVAEAHRAGIRVFTHTVTLNGAKIAARAGVDVLVHGIGDAPVDQELIGLLKEHGTYYVSTLAVYEPKESTALPARAAALLSPQAKEASRGGHAAAISAARQRRWALLLQNVQRLHAAGIPVASGTDAGMAGTYHGYAALHEMELMVEAGLTPLEALTAATGVSARAIRAEGERGTIAEGKLADLLLVEGRPDEDIRDIEKTRRVFLGGRELELGELTAAIQGEAMTPLPRHKLPALVDDMEGTDGRTSLGTLRVDTTDMGVDHSRLMFMPIPREAQDHGLLVEAEMAAKRHPFVRLELPLTPGAVELADLSPYSGLSFETRGEGVFHLLFKTYDLHPGSMPEAQFAAPGSWTTVRIPFSSLQGASSAMPHEVRSLFFELSGSASGHAWLELDNVRFY